MKNYRILTRCGDSGNAAQTFADTLPEVFEYLAGNMGPVANGDEVTIENLQTGERIASMWFDAASGWITQL